MCWGVGVLYSRNSDKSEIYHLEEADATHARLDELIAKALNVAQDFEDPHGARDEEHDQ